MHARGMSERIAARDRLVDPAPPGHDQAGADRVAGPQERAEIGFVLGPQGRGQQVVPTLMRSLAPLFAQLRPRAHPDPAHASAGSVAPFPTDDVMVTI